MNRTETIECLDRLIAFPSVCTAESYIEITDYAQDRLQSLGFTCHRLPGRTGGRAGLFASIGPAGRGGVLLSAHLDVVPVMDQAWTSEPFRLTQRGERLYGRGTCDMKGFVAATLTAASRASGRNLKAPLKIALSYDEELGCLGIAEMIDRLESTIGLPDWCIVGEPTSMRVTIGHKGKSTYKVHFRGVAGHSSAAPDYLNALHLAADFIGILRNEQAHLAQTGPRDLAYDIPYSTVHAGTLHGGTTLNTVPGNAILEFEIRNLVAEPPESVLEPIRAAAAKLASTAQSRFPDAGIEIEPSNAYPGLEVPADSDVAALVGSLGGLSPPVKVSFGTEAGFFQRLDIPTVVCGPGSIKQAHKPDEFIDIAQLAACDAMLDRLLDRIS